MLKKTLNAFKKGTLELRCPKMVLRQEGTDTPVVTAGSGVIRQDSDRILEFVLLDTKPVSVRDKMRRYAERSNNWRSGQLLPDDEYFSLEATDIDGVAWHSQRLRIDEDSGLGGSAISGTISRLEHEQASPRFVSPFHLQFIGNNIEVPCNAVTATETVIALDKAASVPRQNSMSRNASQFHVGPFQFLLVKEDNVFSLEATASDGAYPEYLEIHILEALQFITGLTLSWTIMTKAKAGSTLTCLRSSNLTEGERATNPPIASNHDVSGQWVWPLFGKYLNHVLQFVPDGRFQVHPISAWLNSVRDAHTVSSFARGLAMGVAVEGILETEFLTTGQPPAAHVEAVNDMIAHVRDFNDESVVNRTIGALRSMQKARAKDRLLALQNAGLVRPDDVKAWDAIRNRGAHARPPEDDEIQGWIDDCHKVEVLIHHLIFRAIGYEGRFTDYGTTGWPAAEYRLGDSPSASANPCS